MFLKQIIQLPAFLNNTLESSPAASVSFLKTPVLMEVCDKGMSQDRLQCTGKYDCVTRSLPTTFWEGLTLLPPA